MRMIGVVRTLIAMVALVAIPGWALADSDIFHNSALPTDVDGNHLVETRDAQLIIDLLMHATPVTEQSMAALAQPQSSYFYDTSGDHMVSPRDAVLVINHLLHAVPEPSSVIMAGLGLAALLEYARRKRQRRC